MAYDHDSFLAGLAVGRTLWRPHSISEKSLMLVNCFVCGTDYPLNWTFTRSGVNYNFKSVNISVRGHEQETVYWIIWYQPKSVGLMSDKVNLVIFVPAGGWIPEVGSTYLFTISGELENGEIMTIGDAGITFYSYSSSTVARYRTQGYELEERYSPDVWKESYRCFAGYLAQLTSFMENARMVGTGNNLFLLGEVT